MAYKKIFNRSDVSTGQREDEMDRDHQILKRVKGGDANAFSEIVQKHQRPLLCIVLRMVGDLEMAEDVVQEAFMKAYLKLHTFEGRSKFKSWLFQIALNTAKNRLRTKKNEPIEIEKVNVATQDHQESDLSQQDLQATIRAEVEKLPPKQKMALSLRIFEDMSFAEIAEVMSCPYDTAKANYRHALMKLRHSLGDSAELKNWNSNVNNTILEAEA